MEMPGVLELGPVAWSSIHTIESILDLSHSYVNVGVLNVQDKH